MHAHVLTSMHCYMPRVIQPPCRSLRIGEALLLPVRLPLHCPRHLWAPMRNGMRCPQALIAGGCVTLLPHPLVHSQTHQRCSQPLRLPGDGALCSMGPCALAAAAAAASAPGPRTKPLPPPQFPSLAQMMPARSATAGRVGASAALRRARRCQLAQAARHWRDVRR